MKNVQILAKWRSLLAGWQLGTRSSEDPEAHALRDHREATLILRAEVSALAALLVEKKVFTSEEFFQSVDNEAILLSKSLEQRFPGATATEYGLHVDADKASPWLSKFPK